MTLPILAGSFDELMCDVTTPPLSSVNVASERIGHDAAQLLDHIFAGNSATDRADSHSATWREQPTIDRLAGD